MTLTVSDPRLARLLATLASQDAEQIRAMCHTDLVVEDAASLPYGGVYRGFEGLAEIGAKMFAHIADCRIEPQQIIGEPGGDDFVIRQRITGRAVRSGRPIDVSVLEHYSFRDGLLASIRPYYWDTKAVADALAD